MAVESADNFPGNVKTFEQEQMSQLWQFHPDSPQRKFFPKAQPRAPKITEYPGVETTLPFPEGILEPRPPPYNPSFQQPTSPRI
ncbi:hypothetical protein HZS_6625 [Henneguya salminicola]|nr:hypothetical protein HZS_6625 [Henneguya salminicola]